MCAIDPALKDRLKAFRFRKTKTNAAIIMKIDSENMVIIEDVSFDQDILEVKKLKLAIENSIYQLQEKFINYNRLPLSQ